MLELKNTTMHRGTVSVRTDLFTCKDGELCIIQGENGSGKTTFLDGVIGIPGVVCEGDITFEGESVKNLTLTEKAKKGIYYVPQHIPKIEGLSLIKMLYGVSSEKNNDINILDYKKEVEALCDEYGLDKELLMKDIGGEVSGGQIKQMEMIGLIVTKPKLALLDEIDSGVDQTMKGVFRTCIKKMQEAGTGFVVISHDSDFITQMDATLYLCSGGVITKK